MELGLGPPPNSKVPAICTTFCIPLLLACDYCLSTGNVPFTTGSLSLIGSVSGLHKSRNWEEEGERRTAGEVRAPRVCGRKQIPLGNYEQQPSLSPSSPSFLPQPGWGMGAMVLKGGLLADAGLEAVPQRPTSWVTSHSEPQGIWTRMPTFL